MVGTSLDSAISGSIPSSMLLDRTNTIRSYSTEKHFVEELGMPSSEWNTMDFVKTAGSLTRRPDIMQATTNMECDDKMPSCEQSTRHGSDKINLTHVNPAGEAYMVDVSSKSATRRVAIAQGYVRFSNSQPMSLILDNSNKKGDVLGTARIAGLMAAKRTADLIPLCHPVSISKAEVDITMESSNQESFRAMGGHGHAAIQARVDCTGVTGVEMEALTAVAITALTIYDMCKAVDKGMVIEQAKLVYKSGGKSGNFLDEEWYTEKGRRYIGICG